MKRAPSRSMRVIGSIVGILLLLPTLVVVPMSLSEARLLSFPPKGISLQWYAEFFGDEMWMSALRQSLLVAALTTVLAVVLGIPTALAIAQGKFRGKTLIQVLILSPMIMPLVVLAFGLFLVLSKWHILGSVGGLVLAHTVVAYPLVFIAISTSLSGLDKSLAWASSSLGATPWQTFFRVTLPMIAPGVGSGALFAFITSWDELILSTFLTGPTVKTLPVRMWEQVQTELNPTLAVAATLVMVVTIGLILVAMAFSARRKVATQ